MNIPYLFNPNTSRESDDLQFFTSIDMWYNFASFPDYFLTLN